MPLAESSNSCNHLLILIVLRYSCQWQFVTVGYYAEIQLSILACYKWRKYASYVRWFLVVCNCLLFIRLTSFFVTELSGTGGVLLAAAIWSISGQLGVAKARSLYISWWRPIQCSMFLALSRTKFACIIIMTSRKTLGKYVQQPTF